jgi:hypothetical protein
MLIDTQIKRAKFEAEQNFKLEMGKMKKELQSVQVLTEQQGKVIATLSKDLGVVATEMQRMNSQVATMQQQLLSQRQVASGTQLALDRGIKQLVDMDKRLLSVGAPPSSGMMRAFVGGLTQAAEMHEQQQQHLAHQMLVREAHVQGLAQAQGLMQQGRTRSRKGKKEGGKTLRAEAPEFIPSAAPNGAAGDSTADGGDDAD